MCARFIALAFALVAAAGCAETLDAGHDRPHGMLPVDYRNPIVLLNDGAYDNWSGEYAVMLANGGGSPLAAIIVNESQDWPDIATNVGGYRALVMAARLSGLTNLPDPTSSVGAQLARPPSGNIDDTKPNRSEGAILIGQLAKSVGSPYRPLVIATGGALTDVADAYLVDHTVPERVVVVSSLGSSTNRGGEMGAPNGDHDPWADVIVTSRFHYVQVSAWYDQLTDVTDAKVAELPDNPLGKWVAGKQPNLWGWSPASDQVSVLAVGLPAFATAIKRASAAASIDAGATAGPSLAADPTGDDWIVSGCDGAAATSAFWKVLRGTH